MDSELNQLIKLIDTLRGEEGCPWDKAQTPRSMVNYLIEEVYELVDAIESDAPEAVREELGDVLFQVFFIAGLYAEGGDFDIHKVAGMGVEKMTRRHPHVFGESSVDSPGEVTKRWHEIKNEENIAGRKESIIDSVPSNMPALMRAYRISDRAAREGFDWPDVTGVIAKVEEEWEEFRSEFAATLQTGENRDRVAMEFGDILFSLVNVARFANVHPETALSASIRKFEQRFKRMEAILAETGEEMGAVSFERLNQLWETAKADVDV